MKVLLVVDVQKEYIKKYDNNLLFKINKRIQNAIENNELVVYVKNVKISRSGKMVYEFVDGLNVCSSYVIYKEKSSVFSDNILLNVLRENSVTQIEIIGIDGNCCVASSAIDACKLGYKAVLSCKYIGVKNPDRFEKRKEALIKQGITILP